MVTWDGVMERDIGPRSNPFSPLIRRADDHWTKGLRRPNTQDAGRCIVELCIPCVVLGPELDPRYVAKTNQLTALPEPLLPRTASERQKIAIGPWSNTCPRLWDVGFIRDARSIAQRPDAVSPASEQEYVSFSNSRGYPCPSSNFFVDTHLGVHARGVGEALELLP